jgi:hypothetical protein
MLARRAANYLLENLRIRPVEKYRRILPSIRCLAYEVRVDVISNEDDCVTLRSAILKLSLKFPRRFEQGAYQENVFDSR